MNQFKLLVKNQFDILIGTITGKKARKKTIPAALLLILMGLGFAALSTFQSYSIFLGMSELGINKIALFNGVLIAFIIILLSAVMRITGSQTFNDASLLLSMPIKKSTIVLAKTVSKYLFDFFMVFVFLMPYVVFFVLFEKVSFALLLSGFLLAMLLPLFSVGFSYLLDFVMIKVFQKSKHANLLKTLTSLVFFLFTMALLMFSMPSYGLLNPQEVDKFVSQFVPINVFLDMIVSFNFQAVVITLAITLLPFLLGLILFAKNFNKPSVVFQGKKTMQWENKTSTLLSLTNKELKTYFTTPIYLLNTIVGPIFVIGLTVFLALQGKAGLDSVIPGLDTQLISAALTIMICFCVALTMVSASAISLEGKQIWILKSLPINPKIVLFSKTIPNLLLTLPVTLIGSIVLSFVFELSLLQSLFLILVPLLVGLLVSFGGLIINLHYPKLDWQTETEVVKQGMSTMLTLLFGFILVFLPIGMFLLTQNLIVSMVFGLLFFTLLSVLLTIYLFVKGPKLLQTL